MKDNSLCNLVKDLLPIYMDGIASDKTNIFVEKHLNECEICMTKYKKLCEGTKNKNELFIKEKDSIKSLKKRIVFFFLLVIVVATSLTGIYMFCEYTELSYRQFTFITIIEALLTPISTYVTTAFALFFSIILRKTVVKKKDIFWANVIVSFIIVCFFIEVISLLCRFSFVLSRFYL